MARCSAAKAEKNPKTNFMAPGDPYPQVAYGAQIPAAANM
jgi:NADH dehydrogenase (ubiquinone) Fe-S protein 1